MSLADDFELPKVQMAPRLQATPREGPLWTRLSAHAIPERVRFNVSQSQKYAKNMTHDVSIALRAIAAKRDTFNAYCGRKLKADVRVGKL